MIKKVVLSFPVDATDRSLTYDLVKLYDIRINILKAEIQAGKSGNLLVELEADTDKLDQGIAYLIENGVTVSPVSSKVSYDEPLYRLWQLCIGLLFPRVDHRGSGLETAFQSGKMYCLQIMFESLSSQTIPDRICRSLNLPYAVWNISIAPIASISARIAGAILP